MRRFLGSTARRQFRRLLRAVLPAILATTGAAGAQPIRTVAFLGQTAPGFGDPLIVFKSFNAPLITQAGDVAFFCTVGTDAQPFISNAIYRWVDGPGLTLVAREGVTPVTNAEPTSVNIAFLLNDLRMDETGRVAFPALIDGSQSATFLWDAGSLTLLARPGAPMKIFGHHVTTGNPISVVANLTMPTGFGEAAAFHAGKLIFKASLQSGTYDGLWVADATHTCTDTTPADPQNPVENNCVNLLNDIMDAPGAPGPPARPRFTSFGGVVRNPAGAMGAVAYFTTAENPVGFYRFDDAGAPTFIVRGNKPFAANPEELAMTTVGGLAFHGGFYVGGTPQDGDPAHVGLHVEEVGLRQVYQAFTTPAPGIAGAELGNPLGLALADNGLAFGALDIDKPGDPLHQKNGIWRETAPWTLALLAHEGQPFPGGGGATFDRLYTAHVNRQGQYAFFVKKAGPGITAANDLGLFALDGAGIFDQVLSEGDLVQLEDATLRTVANFVPLGGITASDTLVSGPGTEGRASALNQQGDFALRMDFLDGSAGVFVIPLGEYVPPTPPRLVGLEVVQVIQDLYNSIPLTEHKRTFVRAHLEADQPGLVTPLLYGTRDGLELPGSPLAPANFAGTVVPVLDALAVRKELGASPYFELPESWTSGTIELTAELDGILIDCQEAAGPTPHDCEAVVTFTAVDVPQVNFVKMAYSVGGVWITPSDADVENAVRRLKAAYPISQLAWSMEGRSWTFGGSFDDLPCAVASSMEAQRALDGCTPASGCQEIYYGVLFRDRVGGCAHGIPSNAAAGYVRANPKALGRLTVAHEIGHVLGRQHSVKESFGIYTDPADGSQGKIGACCEIAALDAPDFPNFQSFALPNQTCNFGTPLANGLRPALGSMILGPDFEVWGLDSDQMLAVDPNRYFDLMSYCRDTPIHFWPSEHTYEEIRQAINARFAPVAAPPPARAPAGTAQLMVRGEVDFAAGSVELFPLARIPELGTQPPPPSGDYSLRLLDGSAGTLQLIPFQPQRWIQTEGDPSHRGSFMILVDDDPAIREIRVEHDADVEGSLVASAHAPSVAVLTPNGGETLSTPEVTLTWDGQDQDGDPLTYTVQYSADGGTTWTTLAMDLAEESLTLPKVELTKTTAGLVRVQASDGFDSSSDASDGVFAVTNNAPSVAIDSPRLNPVFNGSQLIRFAASAFDREEGLLGPAAFAWSSNVGGQFMTGNGFELLASDFAPGPHWVTVTATDADGATASAALELWIDVPGLFFADGFEAGLESWSNVAP